MKQVNHGYADYYYLLKDGSLYNAANNKMVRLSKEHIYIIRTVENKRKKIALKTLYKLVYNEPYSKDSIENIDKEVWKKIDDTDGLYYVSSKGRIKSLQGYETIILKSFHNQSGYARVDIIENGKKVTKLVHRLVAAAFLPIPKKFEMQLHHKDFDKDNNAADNLEWLTAAEHSKKHTERSKEGVDTESEEDIDRKNK